MEFTTMERLQMKVSASYGAVIQFGDKVFVRQRFTSSLKPPMRPGLATLSAGLHPGERPMSGSKTTATQLPGAWHR